MTASRAALAAFLAGTLAVPAFAVQHARQPASAPASAPTRDVAPVQAPAFKAGSSWTFHIGGTRDGKPWETDGQWTLLSQDAQGVWAFARGAPGKLSTTVAGHTATNWNGRDSTPDRPAEPDRPVTFPLVAGNAWDAVYDMPASTHWNHTENHYRAIGWEEITVDAGKFMALKIEMSGSTWEVPQPLAPDTAASAASAPAPAASTPDGPPQTIVRAVSWYVPAAQNFVRQEAAFGPPDSATMDTVVFELTKFSLAK